MNVLAWFSAIAWTCASGCTSSSTDVADPPPGQPIGFTFESTAGSFASFGWTGALHDVEEPLDTPFGVKTTECTGGPDGVCRFEGPSDPVSKVNRRRCLFHMSKTCNTDGDCPLDSGNPTPCVYIYDAPISTPLASANGKRGACGWSYIPIAGPGQAPTIAGTLNLASADLNLENLRILLPLNSSPTGFYGACAECVGDPTPNDGVKGGICRSTTHLGKANGIADDGPDIGMPCDVNRYGTIPGFEGSYSMDCSPTVISVGKPTEFGGSFTSQGFQISITDKSPPCGTMGEKCFCGMCSDDNTTACESDGDCSGGGSCLGGAGSTSTLIFNVASNACPDRMCDWDPSTDLGKCHSDPTIFCYPGGVGSRIIAPGYTQVDHRLSTIYYANTANARCIAAGKSAVLNAQLGLPGLLFQKRNFKIIPEFMEN